MTDFHSLLIGTWELLEYCTINADDPSEVVYPLGKTCNGKVFYTDDGYMSAFLQSSDIKPYKSYPTHSTVDELAAAASQTIAYCGVAYINEQPGTKKTTIVHHCHFSLPPNMNDTVQTRVAELVEENGEEVLILQPATPFLFDDGIRRIHRLKWKRAPRNESTTPPETLKNLGRGFHTTDD